MEPVTPVDHNFTYFAPPGLEGEVGALKVRRESTDTGMATFSAWRPTDTELAILNAGGVVELGVWQAPPPPVSVAVGHPTCPECGRATVFDEIVGVFTCAHVETDTDVDPDED